MPANVSASTRPLAQRGIPYRGILYAGIMLTDDGPKVLEFNCRFGDPEAQVLLPLLASDPIDVMLACAEGRLDKVDVQWRSQARVGVVMTSGGYPGAYEKGKPITGIEDAEQDPGVTVFHAGTALKKDGGLVTSGGRVLGVCAMGNSLREAQQKANAACEKIHFDGAFSRQDIGCRVM